MGFAVYYLWVFQPVDSSGLCPIPPEATTSSLHDERGGTASKYPRLGFNPLQSIPINPAWDLLEARVFPSFGIGFARDSIGKYFRIFQFFP